MRVELIREDADTETSLKWNKKITVEAGRMWRLLTQRRRYADL
jgi:hypothetical protein